jgi:hypothetical protein
LGNTIGRKAKCTSITGYLSSFFSYSSRNLFAAAVLALEDQRRRVVEVSRAGLQEISGVQSRCEVIDRSRAEQPKHWPAVIDQ